jgi:hypothetical protein
MSVVTVTPDGKKVAVITVSGSGSVGATSTEDITVTIPLGPLAKVLQVLGVTSVSVSGGTAYLVGFTATPSSVTVTIYNPGTSAVTYTVTVTVVVLGV